jgi:hypothetical protein
VTAGAGVDKIKLSGDNNVVTLNDSAATVTGGQGMDSVAVNGGEDSMTFSGWNNEVTVSGIATVSITDLGDALQLHVASATQTDTLTNFGSGDPYGVVDLINGVGGFASVNGIVAALHGDGHGGALLVLGSTGSIDFAGVAPTQLHASNFAIG